MAEWQEASDLRDLAAQVISCREEVAHCDVDEILFLRELETKPSSAARCYLLTKHPIGFFTDKRFAIVVYWQNCDCMTKWQLALLMMHELMHIPPTGDKLVDHDVQDFRAVLGLDLDWTEPGREVPDILGVRSDGEEAKATKSDGRAADPEGAEAPGGPARPAQQDEEHR